jgi:signal transduction histidine kinase
MSWLPAIAFAGNRWWLPLSRPAADVIASILMRSPSQGHSLASTSVDSLASLMRQDPPLALFVAFKLATTASAKLPEGDSPVPSGLSFEQLASRSVTQLSDWFASGDAFLGAPVDRDVLVSRWHELHQSFIRMPHSRWCAAADQWLALTGPVVTDGLRESFPTLRDDDAALLVPEPEPLRYAASQLDLGDLARRLCVARKLESSFAEAVDQAKRAALKQFAYGLSHEINNPLANISARAQALMRDETSEQRRQSMQRIIDQSMRAHEMVADLMFYAHPPKPQMVECDVASVLQAVVDQTRATVAERDILIRVVPAKRLMLVRNAVEAIGCDGVVELAQACVVHQGRAGVLIEVRDSGPGLSELARKHAFDPYFSGREAGRGLGVGLCRVDRIASLHGGRVSLVSGPAGCTARLWIPAAA